MREKRLRLILAIIESNKIRNQEELVRLLSERGVTVTQATLSRDLKFLRIGREQDKKGLFYITSKVQTNKVHLEAYLEEFSRGFVAIDAAGNLGVIKTLPAHANSVAIALDNLDLESVLGTVAGDDTVFVALKEGTTRDSFVMQLKSIIPSLEVE